MVDVGIVVPEGVGMAANAYHSIDDLPLTDEQKVAVLEWFGRKLWVMLEEGRALERQRG